MTKTRVNPVAVFLLITLAAATAVRAQDYPAKPIALIMPFAAGGPGDAMARHLGAAMSDKWRPIIQKAGVYAD